MNKKTKILPHILFSDSTIFAYEITSFFCLLISNPIKHNEPAPSSLPPLSPPLPHRYVRIHERQDKTRHYRNSTLV